MQLPRPGRHCTQGLSDSFFLVCPQSITVAVYGNVLKGSMEQNVGYSVTNMSLHDLFMLGASNLIGASFMSMSQLDTPSGIFTCNTVQRLPSTSNELSLSTSTTFNQCFQEFLPSGEAYVERLNDLTNSRIHGFEHNCTSPLIHDFTTSRFHCFGLLKNER